MLKEEISKSALKALISKDIFPPLVHVCVFMGVEREGEKNICVVREKCICECLREKVYVCESV